MKANAQFEIRIKSSNNHKGVFIQLQHSTSAVILKFKKDLKKALSNNLA